MTLENESEKLYPAIVRKKLSDVKLAPYNPRTISPAEREKLKKSIETFGYADLMTYNKRTGNVVGGNQRLIVFKEMGVEQLDFIEVDLPLEREKILNLALNKISGEWDTVKLRDILYELKSIDADVSLTGFDKLEIDNLLTTLPDFNPAKEWAGMPEYVSNNTLGRTIAVHFKDEKAVEDFAKLVNQKITDKTRYIWFPYQPPEQNKHLRWKAVQE